jgi:hypothetical protein
MHRPQLADRTAVIKIVHILRERHAITSLVKLDLYKFDLTITESEGVDKGE